MVLVVRLTHVGQVGPEIKQLQRGQHCRQHPKKDQILGRNKKLQDIEGHRHQQNLPNTDILPEKTQVPDQEFSGRMVVGVFVRRHKPVVLVVLWVQFPVEIKGE